MPIALLLLLLSIPSFAKPISVVLSLKSKITMEQLAENVQNPQSPHFGVYYTPDEIRSIAAIDDNAYTEVLSQLRTLGFEITMESKTHLWLTVKGEESLFRKPFNAPKVAGLPKGILELKHVDNQFFESESTGLFKPKMRKAAATAAAPLGLDPDIIKSSYQLNDIYKQGLSGQKQHIAIATFDGFNINNINKYYQSMNLSPGPKIDQIIFNGTPQYDEESAQETEMDASFAGLVATGANVHVYASAENTATGELEMLNAILDDNQSKIVSYSWGVCETSLSPTIKQMGIQMHARAVAQGVNILVASGDDGAYSCGTNEIAADWPSVSPYVVSVGGTTFRMNRSNILSEIGWSGSGGGFSTTVPKPFWQKNLNTSSPYRSYPDVALNADPRSGQGYWTTLNGKQSWLVVGGTSMSAPHWAGFLALVGEARENLHKTSVGYINPIIYAMTAEMHSKTFNDILMGSNGPYSAARGWDPVTGWGSFKGFSLLEYLSQ